MKKFVYAIAIIALSVSSCQDLTVERSNNGTIKIGKVVISNGNNIVTKASSGTNITNNGDIIVEESINPSETPLTKASEISTLGDFYLEGYLDSSIMDKVAASDADKRDQHFIKSALVEKGENGWTIAGAPVWRNFVEHYFWAYAGSEIELQPVVENDYTKMSFSYDAQANDGDLIVAYTSQGGEVDHSDHAASAEDNYIKNLVFNHALAEIVIDPSGLTYQVDGEEVNPHGYTHDLEVVSELNSVSSSSSCLVDFSSSDDIFSWSEDSDSDVSLTFDSKNSSFFVIPQQRSHVLFMQITDKLTGFSFPHQAELSNVTWSSGWKYTYTLKSTVTVPPYIDGNQYQGFNFNASGGQTTGKLVGGLPSKYIETIDLDWTGLPSKDANGVYFVLYFAKEQMSDAGVKSMYNDHTDASNDFLVFGAVAANNDKNSSTKYQYGATCEIVGSDVTLKGVKLPYNPDASNEVYNLYAYYSGGSNGGGSQHASSNLILQNLNVTIASKRY